MNNLIKREMSERKNVRKAARMLLAFIAFAGWGNMAFAQGAPPITKAVAAGRGHSLFLKNDGTVWASGFNINGELGDSTTDDRSTAVQVKGLTNITAVAAGNYFSLFLRSDSTVWAVGDNSYGQLGNGTFDEEHVPVQVTGLSGIIAIASGGKHSLFLKSDSTVWGAGSSCCGQLGVGDFLDHETPEQIATLTGVSAIAAGGYHSLFLKGDGTVWGAGDNAFGQLGNDPDTVEMTDVPIRVSNLVNITAIRTGDDHSLFLKSDSTVWGCGWNAYSQLGDGTDTNRFIPVQASGVSGIVQIAAGDMHSLFLKKDSTVWGVGFNALGNLGDGTNDDRTVAVHINGLDHITQLAGGDGHSIYLRNDCDVLTTGYNNTGQLADGTNTDRNIAMLALTLCTSCNPDVSNFTATSATSVCAGYSSAITIHSTTLIPDTTYTANYTLSGASGNTGTFTSAPFVYGSDSGSFMIDAVKLPGTGTTTVTVNYISKGICNSATPASGNTADFTVFGNPLASAGNDGNVCNGFDLELTSTASGEGPITYAWTGPNEFSDSNQNTSVPTATSAATGTYTVVVTDANACTDTATTAVIVNPNPVISSIGYTPACENKPLSLSSTTTGGTPGYTFTWNGPNSFTSNQEDPLVSAAVTTAADGSYQLVVVDTNSCADTATTSVTVYPIQPIIGATTVAFGQTITLSDSVTGGTWNTATPWTTKVTAATGEVKGVSTGTSEITYTTTHGCVATYTVSVYSLVNACVGQTIILSDGIAGGTWTSGSAGIATVVTATGVVTGVSAGKVVMTHRIAPASVYTTTVTVNPLAATMATLTSVCQGQTLAVTNTTAGGGTWYSGNTTTAAVSNSGVVTGIAGGNVVIYFTPVAGCVTTKTITVTPVTPITGPSSVCISQTITLANATSGGSWSTSNGSMATVYNGIVGGVSVNTPIISYKLPNGCAATAPITVKALAQITGGSTVICQDATMTLVNTTAGGGTWSSDNKFSVNASGVATAINAGTGFIYFNANNGCVATKTVTVNPSPVIGGTPSVCVGQTTLLSSSLSGGTWSSTNGSQATVYNGTVGGVGAGTPNISYKMPTGCFGVAAVTVKALSPISGGSTSICPTGTTTFTNATSGGGVWSSSVPSVATVSGNVLITGAGAAAGSKTVISFTSTANGCVATRTVTIVACRDAGTTETPAITAGTFDVQLYPNPNNGSFTLKGTIDATIDDVNIEVVNMLGQIAYRSKVYVQNGNIDERIQLDGALAKGTYILNLRSASGNKLFHFVIAQ